MIALQSARSAACRRGWPAACRDGHSDATSPTPARRSQCDPWARSFAPPLPFQTLTISASAETASERGSWTGTADRSLEACDVIRACAERFERFDAALVCLPRAQRADIEGRAAKCIQQQRRFPFVLVEEARDGRVRDPAAALARAAGIVRRITWSAYGRQNSSVAAPGSRPRVPHWRFAPSGSSRRFPSRAPPARSRSFGSYRRMNSPGFGCVSPSSSRRLSASIAGRMPARRICVRGQAQSRACSTARSGDAST